MLRAVLPEVSLEPPVELRVGVAHRLAVGVGRALREGQGPPAGEVVRLHLRRGQRRRVDRDLVDRAGEGRGCGLVRPAAEVVAADAPVAVVVLADGGVGRASRPACRRRRASSRPLPRLADDVVPLAVVVATRAVDRARPPLGYTPKISAAVVRPCRRAGRSCRCCRCCELPKPMILPPDVVVVLNHASTVKVCGPVPQRPAPPPGTPAVPANVVAVLLSPTIAPAVPRVADAVQREVVRAGPVVARSCRSPRRAASSVDGAVGQDRVAVGARRSRVPAGTVDRGGVDRACDVAEGVRDPDPVGLGRARRRVGVGEGQRRAVPPGRVGGEGRRPPSRCAVSRRAAPRRSAARCRGPRPPARTTRTVPGASDVSVGVSSVDALRALACSARASWIANRTRPCWAVPLTRGNSPPSTTYCAVAGRPSRRPGTAR